MDNTRKDEDSRCRAQGGDTILDALTKYDCAGVDGLVPHDEGRCVLVTDVRAAIATHLARQPKAEQPTVREEIAGVNIPRLLRNLEETSYNEGAMDLACRLSDCHAVINALLAAPVAPAGAQNEEILALHRQLAAEKLRADQGWERAKAKAKECIELRERQAGAQNAEAIRNQALADASEVCNKICKEYQGHAARRGADDEDFYDAYMNKSLAAWECMEAIRALQSGTASTKTGEADA